MASSRDQVETRVEALAQELAELRERVGVLEKRQGLAVAASTRPAPPGSDVVVEAGAFGQWWSAESVGFVGRTLVILGGAFLLRAISAAALLPDIAGPLVGLAYAAWWLWTADRSPAAAGRVNRFFYGVAGIAIAYPLIWETTARFRLLPDLVAAPALVLFLGAGLAVAARQDLRALAWISLAATLVAALGLLPATHEFILYTGTLLLAAAGIEAFGFGERWPELRWAAAAAIDATLMLLAVLVSQPRLTADMAAALPATGVVAVSLLAPAIDLASVARSTLAKRRPIGGVELLQLGASLLIGIGTALVAIRFLGGQERFLALGIAALGVVCYVVAFRSIDAAEHPRRNFHAYSSLAGVLVAAGSALLLDSTALAQTWFLLSWAGVAAGVRLGRTTLRLHGALYLAASALASGLGSVVLRGLVGPADSLTPELDPTATLVAAGSLAAYAALARWRSVDDTHWSAHLPRAIVAAVAVLTVAGLGAPVLTRGLLAALPALDASAYLASMRTCLVSTLAVASAWAGRRWSLEDLGWLVVPLMAATGVRLLWEDVSLGGPVNLFLALGFYGGAMIAVSRLLRTRARPDGEVR